MTIALDGHTSGGNPNTLTTTSSNDIIVACWYSESQGATATTVTGVSDTAGLTWHKRSGITASQSSIGTTLEVWWAFSSSVLSSDVITFANTGGGTQDGVLAVSFGVNGLATSSPWDPNVSLPGSQASAASAVLTNTITTDNANDFLLAVAGATNKNPRPTTPTGFSAADSFTFTANLHGIWLAAAFKIVSAAQAGATVAWGGGGTTDFSYLLDAMTADGASPGAGPLPFIRPRPLLRR